MRILLLILLLIITPFVNRAQIIDNNIYKFETSIEINEKYITKNGSLLSDKNYRSTIINYFNVNESNDLEISTPNNDEYTFPLNDNLLVSLIIPNIRYVISPNFDNITYNSIGYKWGASYFIKPEYQLINNYFSETMKQLADDNTEVREIDENVFRNASSYQILGQNNLSRIEVVNTSKSWNSEFYYKMLKSYDWTNNIVNTFINYHVSREISYDDNGVLKSDELFKEYTLVSDKYTKYYVQTVFIEPIIDGFNISKIPDNNYQNILSIILIILIFTVLFKGRIKK